jgi:hypothetical protein
MKKTLLILTLICMSNKNAKPMLNRSSTNQIGIFSDSNSFIDEETAELNRLYLRTTGFIKDLNPSQRKTLLSELKEIIDKYNRATVDDTCCNICIGATAGAVVLGIGALIIGNR